MSKIRTILGGIAVGFVCATTPRCREMTRLISMDKEVPVSAITALRMRMHYKVCVWCERYRDQVALISELSKEFPESDHGAPGLTEEARERIADAVKKEIT
jgi:hypothetical protein